MEFRNINNGYEEDMNKDEFKSMFDKFNAQSEAVYFDEAAWDDSVKKWKTYYDEIVSTDGLQLDRWLKNDKGYLPDFLDTKEQKFGHSRIGNYEYVMIYQYTGDDKKRKNKYTNIYAQNKEIGEKTELKEDYDKKIKCLLKDIASAEKLDDIYKIEKEDNYKNFSSKAILRKISILCSVMDASPYKHEFMWFFGDKDTDATSILASILEVDTSDCKTFLEKNKTVYSVAKEYADIKESDPKEKYIKLYCFLRFLSDSSYNTNELSDFNNINVIFNGAPGTGKTFGVSKGIEKLQKIDSNKYKEKKYIQFHPSFSYQDFIEGIKPLGIDNNGNLKLDVVNGSLKDFCIKVRKENEDFFAKNKCKNDDNGRPTNIKDWPHYYFVVDEINRGNLSNIFGETFTLLEKDYRDYDFSNPKDGYKNVNNNLISTALSSVVKARNDDNLIYKKIDGEVVFGIPFNIHFIGIMNDVDRSIDAFDLALRRRFKWITKYCNYDVINDVLIDKVEDQCNVDEYVGSCKSLNDFICEDGLKLGKNYEIGHSFFLKISEQIYSRSKKITADKKKSVFENYIAGTIKEYIRQIVDETEVENKLTEAREAFGIK